MKNIENQVIESKKRAEQKIANELKEEQEELYSRIKKHNSEVKRFNKDLGLRPLLKKLANVEVEIKALAQAQDYYEGKHQSA
jgi:sensor domain CHASE-containing protein